MFFLTIWVVSWAERAVYCRNSTKHYIGTTYPTHQDARKAVLYFESFCNILLNFGSHNDGCKLPSSLPHEWLAEWKEQYIVETEWKVLLAQLLKAHAKLCCILQVSAIYCSTLAAIMMAVSFPHHCHMSGWLSGKISILQKLSEKNLLAQILKAYAKLCCILQVSEIYCSTLGSHNDGCKLPSSLPHEWLAEWKEQYIVETERKILFAQNTWLVKMDVKLCWILQISEIYCSTLAPILMAVSFPHHCHMSGWLSGKSSIL